MVHLCPWISHNVEMRHVSTGKVHANGQVLALLLKCLYVEVIFQKSHKSYHKMLNVCSVPQPLHIDDPPPPFFFFILENPWLVFHFYLTLWKACKVLMTMWQTELYINSCVGEGEVS